MQILMLFAYGQNIRDLTETENVYNKIYKNTFNKHLKRQCEMHCMQYKNAL